MTVCPAHTAVTYASWPIGSTTSTSALSVTVESGPAAGRHIRSSGRMPTVTSPSDAPAVSFDPAPSGVVMPRNVTDARPSVDASRPGTKFMRGEPMKPATNLLAGLS